MPASGLKLIVLPPQQRASKSKGIVGDSKRGDLLNRKPEEKIRGLNELGHTTLIGKKRKRRIVDNESSENPYDSDSDSKTKTLGLAKTASDLNYMCKIDPVSEVEIVDAVQSINYSIDNLVSNILAKIKEFNISYRKLSPRSGENQTRRVIHPDLPLNIPLLHWHSLLISSPSPLSDDSKDFVIKIILHNLILLLIHKHFFKGKHFFGVGSEKTVHEYLETMFSKLAADENSDPAAIQRWRSMSAEAVFQMNDGIESQLYDELISHLERMLKVTFSLSPSLRSKPTGSTYESIVYGERKSLLDVIRQARKLSFMIQQVVSCQLLVTVTSSAQISLDKNILATYSFGLQKNLGRDRIILLRAKIFTNAELQSHLRY